MTSDQYGTALQGRNVSRTRASQFAATVGPRGFSTCVRRPSPRVDRCSVLIGACVSSLAPASVGSAIASTRHRRHRRPLQPPSRRRRHRHRRARPGPIPQCRSPRTRRRHRRNDPRRRWASGPFEPGVSDDSRCWSRCYRSGLSCTSCRDRCRPRAITGTRSSRSFAEAAEWLGRQRRPERRAMDRGR